MAISAFDIGFQTNNVIAMEAVENNRRRVIEALASDPEVATIAAASSVPLNGTVPTITGRAENGPTITAAHNDVSPAYLEILGTPILRGRNFTPQESARERSAAILRVQAPHR